MTKIRLLVTRFAPHAQQLARRLNGQGLFALAQPLLEVQKSSEFYHSDVVFAKSYDYIIAVSCNAVDYTAQALQSEAWPISDYLAVGKGTQQRLAYVSRQHVAIPETQFSSEGLLALPCLAEPSGKQVLILRGVGGRALLAQELTQRGAIVDYYQPYKRVAINLCAQQVVAQWQQEKINAVLISSVELLQRLLDLVPESELGWLKANTIYAPSQRILEYALAAGWANVKLLPSMLEQQIVDYFKEEKSY